MLDKILSIQNQTAVVKAGKSAEDINEEKAF